MVFTQWMYLLLLQNAVTFITGFVLAAAQCNHFALCPSLSAALPPLFLYCSLMLLFLSALLLEPALCCDFRPATTLNPLMQVL